MYDGFREHFEPSHREEFVAVFLEGGNRVMGFNVVSVGTLTTALVHPREVFKPAILANGAALVLVRRRSDDTDDG